MKNEMLTQYDSCPVISSSENDLFLANVEALSEEEFMALPEFGVMIVCHR